MVAEAQRRAGEDGVAGRCHFEVQDLSRLALPHRYDLLIGVTVLQHILDATALTNAVHALRDHLAPRGRLVLLEAAPAQRAQSCDSSVFQARHRDHYIALIRASGLALTALTGVDPAPFRRSLVPHLRGLPKPLGIGLLGLATALSFPINAPFGRSAVRRSWHAVFVAKHGVSPGRSHA